MIMWMENVNNFQTANVQPQGVARICLTFFCQSKPSVAYKRVAYKKSVYFIDT